MSFCEHCQGQRFDRARILRALRQLRREFRASGTQRSSCDHVFERVLQTLAELEVPHLEFEDEGGRTVHWPLGERLQGRTPRLRVNAGTPFRSRIDTLLGLRTVGEAAFYAIATLQLPVAPFTSTQDSNATTSLDDINNEESIRWSRSHYGDLYSPSAGFSAPPYPALGIPRRFGPAYTSPFRISGSTSCTKTTT